MSLKVYDVKAVTIAAGGIPLLAGFADGEVVRIERGAFYATKRGADGQVTRYALNDKSAKIRVRLMQSSDANAVLSAFHELDKASSNGAGIFPFIVKDRQGTSKYNAARCWVAKPPEVSFAGEVQIREWELETDELESFDGGN